MVSYEKSRTLFVFTLSVLSLILLCSCGKKSTTQYVNVGNSQIVLDDSLSPEQQEILQNDIQALSQLNLNSNEAYLFGLSDLSSTSLTTWLTSRIRVIVGESFDYDSQKVVIAQNSYSPQITSVTREQLGKVVTVAFNLGSYLYLKGKMSNVVYSLPIGKLGSIVISTPKVGIIQEGEGFSTVNKIPSSPISSPANKLIGLATLFHEGGHGNGNGQLAGVPHAKCQSGTYKGHYACEEHSNGPYALEAAFLRAAYRSCSTCSQTELAGLKLFVSDAESRIQPGADFIDSRSEQIQVGNGTFNTAIVRE